MTSIKATHRTSYAGEAAAIYCRISKADDRLMRQPRDLEELLTIADEQALMLHGCTGRRTGGTGAMGVLRIPHGNDDHI